MEIMQIEGGRALFGEVRVGGSKNAALPIIFATLITHGKSILENLPDIADVRDCISIIRAFGAHVVREGERIVIDTSTLSYATPPEDAVCRIRASTYLIGACLSRFDRAELMAFGGCNFSSRPIDLHLYLAELFGAKIIKNRLSCSGLRAAHAVLNKISVGATVNALLLAASANGVSKITPYAKEPHVFALIDFLRSAGAEIEADGNTLTVVGKRLHGGYAYIVGDMVEAGTYLAAGMVTGGEVSVTGVPTEQLFSFAEPLRAGGALISVTEEKITASGLPHSQINIETGPYPEFATDLQPIIAPILALGAGGSIRDNVWQARYGYLDALSSFGLAYELSGGAAKIKKSALHGGEAAVPDLRGGAACVLSALAAGGTSRIYNTKIISRGYGHMTEKLSALGARIEKIK